MTGDAGASASVDLGHIVLVGAGNMGGAMLRRWPTRARITVIEPNPSSELSDHVLGRGQVLHGSVEDVEVADILVVAIKPQLMSAVLPSLRPLIHDGTVVVSIAAGTTVATFTEALGTSRVVRTIPNTPAMVGAGVTGAFAANGVDEPARRRVSALLECSGAVVWVDQESDIDRVTAVSGSGPAYVFHFVEALAEGARSLGLSATQAEALARQTVVGAGALLAAREEDAGTLRERVTSPGGTTAAALDVLRADEGLARLVSHAVEAAHRRAIELGKPE